MANLRETPAGKSDDASRDDEADGWSGKHSSDLSDAKPAPESDSPETGVAAPDRTTPDKRHFLSWLHCCCDRLSDILPRASRSV